jgi:hypothetical protein
MRSCAAGAGITRAAPAAPNLTFGDEGGTSSQPDTAGLGTVFAGTAWLSSRATTLGKALGDYQFMMVS